jgi:hypothetical protein
MGAGNRKEKNEEEEKSDGAQLSVLRLDTLDFSLLISDRDPVFFRLVRWERSKESWIS